MTYSDIRSSQYLDQIVFKLLETSSLFKEQLKSIAYDLSSDIESASINPNCSCRFKVKLFIHSNIESVGSLVYNFIQENNIDYQNLILELQQSTPPDQYAFGKVAKTSIAEWPTFVQNVYNAGLIYRNLSTSIIGNDVFVFFS